MKLKPSYRAFSFLLLAAISPFANSIGIPTLDAATGLILSENAMAQAKQAASALSTAKDGIMQVKEQYDNYKSIVTGNDKLGAFLNNPKVNQILPMGDWADVYNTGQDIVALRDRYGLTSENASVQQKFDRLLSAANSLERMYDASTERVRNAAELRARLDIVQTPQQKEDLQLRYQQELIELQNQQMRLANMQMLQQQQEKMQNTQRAQAFEDYMLGRTKIVPSY
ncbi:P-type DNA transfer protein VirB5 [Pseudomonas fragariae (ex Marin et al. 2024)]|uniref:P-type DNA transfer protein VirB5 n=1 Tax=Pseudomonas fragariae (ex Marin et al. 2024) TaxID=3080056 RepID=UPI003F79A163